MSSTAKKIFRFGLFEADASSGELRKAGVRLRLQDQPFQVLLIFLERPGEVLSREEIRQRLWPSDTFVDFDHSLNTVINKIREALGDSAANPRFVETLAKRGYRFLAPVDSVLETSPEKIDTHAATDNSAENPSSQPNLGLTRMEDLPVVPHTYVRTLFLLIQTMYLIFYLVALGRLTVAHGVLDRLLGGHPAAIIVLIVSASIGIPVRLYLFSAAAFDIKDMGSKFLKIFPGLLLLDELWALSPFLLEPEIGLGMALAVTAALAYVPFAQRTLILMRDRVSTSRDRAIPTK